MTCLKIRNDDLQVQSLTTGPTQPEQEEVAKILQQQKLDAIGSLACGISHEFNNLLQTIHGYTQFALGSIDAESQAHKDLQHVLHATDRAMVLTRQLLDFSRVEEVNAQCSPIDEIVQELVDMLKPLLPKEIELELNLTTHSTSVLIDGRHIQQALLNLCLNARDAMSEGGTLRIESSSGALADACLVGQSNHQANDYVCVKVIDTGTGIPEEVQQHIFEPFYTTKAVGKGTGLGLAVTFGVIQQAGGHIEFSSTSDCGTTFEVYLPIYSENSLGSSTSTCPDAKEPDEHR